MGQAKAIKINVGGSPRDYMIYEESGALYYMKLADYEANNQQFKNKLDKPSPEEVKWVRSRFFFNRAAPVTLASKIEQDKIKKQMDLMKNIREENVRLTDTIRAVHVLSRAVKQWKSKVAAQQNLPEPSESGLEDPDDASTKPSSTLRSDSSGTTNYSTGSFVESSSDNQSSSIDESERSSFSSSINSRAVEPGSPPRERTVHQLLSGDDDDSSYIWSGSGDLSGEREYQVLPEVDTNEDTSVLPSKRQPRPPSTPYPSPTVLTEDLNAVYRELQAIVDILAQLKGNEPQLENVRKALDAAIDKSKGRVRPSQATVEPPNAGVAGAVTSPTPKVDDIEENIRLLREVQEKLESLLDNYRAKMGPELHTALVQLQKVVENSITEASTIKKTQNLRKEAASARGESGIPLSRMNTDTPKLTRPEGEADDDMTHASNSTPSA